MVDERSVPCSWWMGFLNAGGLRRYTECRVGKEFGSKGEICLFFFMAYEGNDFMVDGIVVGEEVDSDSTPRCQVSVDIGEFSFVNVVIDKEGVLGVERVIVKVDTAVADGLVPRLEYTVWFNVGKARGVDDG